MKTKIATSILCLGVTLFFCSCASTKLSVSAEAVKEEAGQLRRIALLMFAFEPVDKPVFPLIDAAFIRERVNDLGPELSLLVTQRIDEYRDKTARSLAQRLNCEVLYGQQLSSLGGFVACTELYNFTDRLKTEDEAFPEIHLASEEVNFFPIKDGDIQSTFFYRDNYDAIVKDICRKLDADAVAIVHSHFRVKSPDVIMSRANIMMYTYLHVIGSDGNTLVKGEIRSATVHGNPGDIWDYNGVYVTFPANWDALMNEVGKELE